ncbi:TonB-linked SusC/RagA family outer membrane protein [Ulvibacter sp. MAR_2010_11]|uniref:SusC/RagA family TonB-linked outer membrane protein n=1 Tax=Ulvibacter sp. MAR_2010_11 TaxID=1250229 RepID=UPI000C2B7A09|nr:SusC/RagA family TonB-linked outer membrane protein [Ulvibacter sp. MAR_2010_11]PKA83468.1 TonB-linked SusC/RagA family outer membrane protein [Ulvibacter sp. MAR_2010_11]
MKQKIRGILTILLALVVQVTFAQEKTVSGTVSDDTGLPLPGANIIIKETNTGTQSDFDGNYTITASIGQTLVFSYVGFDTQEFKVGAANSINVNMVAGNMLSEVVVTGYSTRNQTVQTSAVVSISASEISELSPTTSVDNLLQGKAAGVQVTAANGKPGQGAFVRIRGVGSLTAGASSPLYVVDGAVIREEDLGNIPNDDIENITILKDAATTARYGSRGASGVVVITTKNGNRNKDAIVKYSSRYGFTSRIKPNFNIMNAEQKLQYEAELYALGVTTAGSLPGVTTLPGSPERQFLLDNQTDWQDLMLKEGIVQNNNVSFSGGSEKMDYYFSVGHDRNTGIIDQLDGFERFNSRLNLNFDAKDWLSLGVNVGYSRSTSDEPRDRNNVQNPFRAMYDYNPYETEFVLDEDGNVVLDENGNPVYSATHTTFNVRGALLSEPAIQIENNLLASVDAEVRFTKDFSYGINVAANSVNQRNESYSKPGGILDAIIGDPNNPGNKLDTGIYRYDFTISNRLNYNLSANNHHLNALGLFEYNKNQNSGYRLRSIGFPSALLTTQSNANEPTLASTTRDVITLVSYGVFADYDYKEKYLASASVRYDGSSNFGSDNRFGVFYSGSLGWNIAKEDFFQVDAINDLKLRAAYGTVGNRNGIARYASQSLVTFGSYPGGSGTQVGNFGNPGIKWETTTTTNVGLEFNLFNRRVRGVTDYFIRRTEDLLFLIPTADEAGVIDTAGQLGVVGNLGIIENRGLEVSLQGDIFKSENFKWTLGGNIVFLDTEIVELPDNDGDGEGDDVFPNTAFNIAYREGQMINEHYLIRYAGVDPATGAPLYYGADGNTYRAGDLPDGENRVFQGKSTIADKEGGFFSNITYKGFGLRTDFVFKAGNWVNNFVKSNLISDGANIDDNQALDAFNYWQQPGDTNVYPSPLISQEELQAVNSDRFLEKGDYVRMRNITLSYNFSRSMLANSPLNAFRVYVQGQNLLTFTKFFGDPEVGLSSGETISFANSVAPGEATLYSYPNTKSIQVGIDVSF